MAYTALYRKFRPTTFSEMVGQEHIIKTLKNQLISGRVGHAYLFNGGRGTGKTTTAKVLARAINCLNPKDGEPCNECEICKAALNSSLTDIVEMDAASNNSVEDIRSIREEVNFLPTLAKYRIYIIDEVHMLSTGAFNALLKTLEEPPEHVKFILATTEPQKIPATILSRCQRFDFKTLSVDDIIKRLQIICDESNIIISNDALRTIAVLAEGGMRDAISILERCIQDGENEISEDKVKDLVGIPKLEFINKLVNNIVEYNPTDALLTINEVLDEGKDLDNFLWEVIKYLKDILLYKTCGSLQLYNSNELEQIKVISEKVSKDRLLALIYDLSELANSIKWSSQKQIVFQTGIIKVCINSNSLEDRVKALEESMSSKTGTTIASFATATPPLDNGGNDIKSNDGKARASFATATSPLNKEGKDINSNVKTTRAPIPTATSQKHNNGKSVDYWPNVINNLKQQGKVMLYTNLINTNAVEINDLVLGIEFPNGLTAFGKSIIEKPENMQELVKQVSIEAGKEMQIKLIDLKSTNNVQHESSNNGLEDLGININIIDN